MIINHLKPPIMQERPDHFNYCFNNQDEYVKISQVHLTTPNLLNEKLSQACKMGFFYLEIPDDCKILIDAAVKFSHSFYQKEEYTSLHLEGVSGYEDQKAFQVESFRLEKSYWPEKMPAKLKELSMKMEAIALDILKKTLTVCNIHPDQWGKASGGVTENQGQIHLTFNHYRPEKTEREGMIAHRDIGQITVLYINQKGLQARIENQWKEVLPVKDHFVINFGLALETAVNNPKQLIAAWHRVTKMEEDRISFAAFTDNNRESNIYIQENGTALKDTGESYKEYFEKKFNLFLH